MSKARDIADLDFNAPDIDGGNIDGAVIGATTAAASTFTDVVAASLDISGDIDVDGTTNLDVVDIDGAVDMASTLTVAGGATFSSDVNIGGNLVIPSSINHTGDTNTFIKFNAADQIQLATGGVERVAFYNSETHFNDSGADVNFIVESDGNANMLFVDGGDNRVGIGSVSSIGGVQLNVLGAGGAFNQVSVGASANSSVSLGNHSSGDVISNLITSSSKFGGVIQGGTNGNLVVGIRDNDVTDGFFVVSGAGNQIASGYSRLRMSITPTTVVFNESGDNTDFRVESDAHTHMLFVDGGTNMLGIDTSAPDYLLDVGNNSSSPAGGQVMRINSNGDTIFSLSKAGTSLFSMRNNSTSYTALSSNSGADLLLGYSASGAGAISDHLRFKSSETVFNEGSADRDFRVESNGNPHALYLDAGNEVLLIGNNARNNAFVDKLSVGLQIGNPGVDNFGGHMFMSQTAPANEWMDIVACHDNNATGVYFTIQGVRTGDQNRSYAATVRYAYSQTFTIMTVSQQNTTVEYRVTSGHVLQYRFTTAGPYFVNLTVMAAG